MGIQINKQQKASSFKLQTAETTSLTQNVTPLTEAKYMTNEWQIRDKKIIHRFASPKLWP